MKRKMMIDKKKVFMAVGALSIGMAGIIACSTFNEYLYQVRLAHENEFVEFLFPAYFLIEKCLS